MRKGRRYRYAQPPDNLPEVAFYRNKLAKQWTFTGFFTDFASFKFLGTYRFLNNVLHFGGYQFDWTGPYWKWSGNMPDQDSIAWPIEIHYQPYVHDRFERLTIEVLPSVGGSLTIEWARSPFSVGCDLPYPWPVIEPDSIVGTGGFSNYADFFLKPVPYSHEP